MRCKFCEERNISVPCVKKWGPKTEARLAPSRPIPTAIDAVIDTADVPLLQFAYSDHVIQSGHMVAGLLTKKFAFVYGPSISSTSLRHAMLACAAFTLREQNDIALLEVHVDRANRALRTRPTYSEADLFAAYLLAAMNARRHNLTHFKVHLLGFAAILEELKNGEHLVPDSLSVFWPYARNDLIWHGRSIGDDVILTFWDRTQASLGSPTFGQSERFCQQLAMERRRPDLVGQWSLTESLYQACTILKRCLRLTAHRQCHGLTGLDDTVSARLGETKRVLNSFETQQMVARFEREMMMKGVKEGTSMEGLGELWLPSFLYHISSFLISLLEAPSIFQGLCSSVEKLVFLSLFRLYPGGLMSFCGGSWYDAVGSTIWIAGLEFSRTDFPDGRCPLLL